MKDFQIFSTDTDNVSIALLIKRAAYTRESIKSYYLRDAELLDKVVAVPLEYEPQNKLSSKFMASYIAEVLPELNNLGIKTLYVADSKYYQYLTKQNVTNALGSIAQCRIKGYEHMQVIAGVNYQSIFHNPNNVQLLEVSINALVQHVSGYDISKPKDIIKSATYLYLDDSASAQEVKDAFLNIDSYISEPIVAIDIETKSLYPHIEKSALRFSMNSISSIAFSKSDSEGSALYFDGSTQGKQLLKNYFIKRATYCQSNAHFRNIYHNGLFDIKQLIYHLFMDNPGDIEGMLYGIKIMCQNIDDTMVMKYLTTNNAQDNSLGLKESILSFTGQYAVDVKDITLLPISELLEYNLKDTLGTRWLYDRLKVDLINEGQEDVYNNVFMPSFEVLLEMMLVGLPLNMDNVAKAKDILEVELYKATKTIDELPAIIEYNKYIRNKAMEDKNAKLKKKVTTIDEYDHLYFNPGSTTQKVVLLYEELGLPILDYTKTKKPATGNKTITKLAAYAKENGLPIEIIHLLDALKDYTDVSKILNTFIKAFELYAFDRGDGTVWLNGDQILCGTISGRLGSRAPNLANMPSNSRFGKLVKSCFQAPKGWVFVGSDYGQLEDRIVAILSDDPNKKLPFLTGVDGHCLNAYGYFKDQMEGITEDNLNDIKNKYPDLRQDSKAPTFALNYFGTYITLMNNCGFSEVKAKAIEAGHKKLYHVLHSWSADNKTLMIKQGYIECAFGLKVRTPLLAKSMLGDSSMLLEAEFRGANNAVTQSWGLLTTRAGTEYKARLDVSTERHNVVNINFIHDAMYGLVRANVKSIKWVNKHMIECMQWQEHPAIQSDEIKLTAELDVGLGWDKMYTLKNDASDQDIQDLLDKLEGHKK